MNHLTSFRLLPGLPADGSAVVSCPADWGRLGREGVVAEFATGDGGIWIGNFEPGSGGPTTVLRHPDGVRVLLFASGNVWSIDAEPASAMLATSDVTGVWSLEFGPDLIVALQGIAFARYGRSGIVWRTRRLSWDGFCQVKLNTSDVSGFAPDPTGGADKAFRIDIATGAASGGSYTPDDAHTWEFLVEGEPRGR